VAGLTAGGKAGVAKLAVAAALASGGIGAGVAEVHHLATKGSGDGSAPAVRNHGAGSNGHSNAVGTSSVATTPVGTSHTKHATGRGHHGHHGKPTSSPAQSPNAATGKGIAGTQPGHGSGTTGKAGAPGQLKAHKNASKTHVHARGRILHRPVSRPVHQPPPPPAKPAEPVKPQPSAQSQQQPTTTVPVTTTDESVTTDATSGTSKK
jgi:hypothetical protein